MERRYVQALNDSLKELMDKDDKVVFVGEDVADPYGGAFKVSKGLKTEFPERVFSTPISESGLTGFATGMALRGFKPIVEIMFGDFMTLVTDQLVNHACKFHWMYNQKVNVPLIIRTPMGGRRGYGPTHSQTLEQMFMSIPQLKIVAPSQLCDPGQLLVNASENEKNPILFIENKLLYAQKICDSGRYQDFFLKRIYSSGYPTILASLTNFQEEPDAVIICYGGMTPLALSAARQLLIDDEINVHVIVPTLINPVPINDIVESLGENPKIIIAEESNVNGGWSGELSSQLYFKLHKTLSTPIQRVGAKPFPIPSSKFQEEKILPSEGDLISAVKSSIRN